MVYNYLILFYISKFIICIMRKAFHNRPNQYRSTIIYEFIDNVDSLKSAVNNYLRKKKLHIYWEKHVVVLSFILNDFSALKKKKKIEAYIIFVFSTIIDKYCFIFTIRQSLTTKLVVVIG